MKTWEEMGIHIPPSAPGPQVYTTCPQCSQHRKKASAKCLSANIVDEVWCCAHCGWSGTLKQGTDRKSNPWENVPKTWKKPTFTPAPVKDATLAWFEKRGITPAVVERNKISAAKIWMPQVEAEVDCIQFPVIRGGEVVNIKSRDGKKNFRQESGAERILYGLDDITGDTAIFVEGEIDKLSLEVAGYLNAVSVPDGAPSPKAKDYANKFSFLESSEELLTGLKRIILAVDNDEQGKVLEEELARRLGREKCHRVTWPEGCKDANEVLVNYGSDILRECIEGARPYPLNGVFEVSDLFGAMQDLYESGLQGGAPPGWKSLNELYSVRTGEWTVVTGIPGHGKSELVDAMMVNLANSEGWMFAIFSPENQPLQRHAAKLAEKYIGKPYSNSGLWHSRMDQDELEKAKRWLQQHFVFVLPPETELTLDAILAKARHTVMRYGIKGMVIDPWNEIDHQRPPGVTETEYISQSLTKVRRFARDFNIHIWLVAHPAKMLKDKAGNIPVPSPYDISGSAHWRNKADNCLTVHRDVAAHNREVDVHVQKIRFKEVGKVGVATLEYDYKNGRYSDVINSQEQLSYDDPYDEPCPY